MARCQADGRPHVVHPLPPLVITALAKEHSTGGLAGDLAWVFSHATLLTWRHSQGRRATVHQTSLPYAPSGKPLVSLLPAQDPSSASAVLCTQDGNLVIWPDISQADSVISERVAGTATSLTAAVQGASTDGPKVFVAIVGTDDGALYHVTISGDSLTCSVRKLGAAVADSPAGGSGMFGRLIGWRGGSPPTPSSHPAVALHMSPAAGDATSLELLVLTHSTLDYWQVTEASERLQWSLDLAQAAQLPGSFQALDVSLVPSLPTLPQTPSALVLAAAQPADSPTAQAVALIVTLQTSAPVVRNAVELTGITPDKGLRCLTNPTIDSFLLWRYGENPTAWSKSAGVRQMDWDCLDAAITEDSRDWRILSQRVGVLTQPIRQTPIPRREARRSVASSGQPESQPESDRQAEQPAQGTSLSGPANTDAIFRMLDEACASGTGSQDWQSHLQGLGAFSGDGPGNPIAAYDTRVVDMLPKHWGGSASAAAISAQLRDKQQHHNMLLQVLGQGGGLISLRPASLRVLFENGEKVAVLLAVREAENARLAEHPQGALPLQEAIRQAGQACKPQAVGNVQAREDWEVFYSSPSLTAQAFFAAVHRNTQRLPEEKWAAFSTLAELSQAALSAMAGAYQQRSWQVQWFATAVDAAARAAGEEWLAGESIRAALWTLARQLISLKDSMRSEAPQSLRNACVLLLELAEQLLNSFAAAQTSSSGRASSALKAEYADARQEVLQPLLEQAVEYCRAGDPEGDVLLRNVESLAEAHCGYAQLFDIAEFRAEPQRLHTHMNNLAPGPGNSTALGSATLAAYVFARLRREGRTSELLSLPEEFNSELEIWLGLQGSEPSRLKLRWLHELRMGRHQTASMTLSQLADTAPPDASLAEVQRTACLSKLAALASLPAWPQEISPAVEQRLEYENARLALLGAQHSLGLGEQPRMHPQQLLQTAVRSERATDAAFEVLGAAGPEFRAANRSLWGDAWAQTVETCDWEAVHARGREIPEQEFWELLSQTPTARAALACYAADEESRALCVGGRFEDEFPAEETYNRLQEIARNTVPAAVDDICAAFQLACG